MTIDRAKTIELARESGNPDAFAIDHGHHLFSLVELERFAALVRAQVIEEAAKKVDEIRARCEAKDVDDPPLEHVAAALRGMKSDSGHSTARAGEASTDLLPCPFCGGTPEIETRDVEPQGDPWYGGKRETFVLCGCGACLFDGHFHEGFWDADTRAAAAWNRRGVENRLIAAAEELLGHLRFAVKLLGALPMIGNTAQVEAMRAAIEKATAAPHRRSLAGDQKQDVQAESASPSVLLIRGEK